MSLRHKNNASNNNDSKVSCDPSTTKGKSKKPFFKRGWFWVLVVLFVIGVGSTDDNPDDVDTSSDSAITDVETDSQDAQVPDEIPDTSADSESEPIPEPSSEPVSEMQSEPAPDSKPDNKSSTTSEAPAPNTAPATEAKPAPQPAPAPAPKPAPAPAPKPAPAPATEADPNDPEERTVYITNSGKRYHFNSKCGNGNYFPVSLKEAKARGLTPCEKCAGG